MNQRKRCAQIVQQLRGTRFRVRSVIPVQPGRDLCQLGFQLRHGIDPVGAPKVVGVGGMTVRLRPCVSVSAAASATFTVKLLVPTPVGVPEITPVVELSASPDGSVPDRTDQL